MPLSDFTALMLPCCTEVLDSMYFTTVFDAQLANALLPASGEVFDFTLHFAGDLEGTFGLRIGIAGARGIAANFLGEEEPDVSEQETADVMGELANMLCGSIVSRIPSTRKFVLSHPLRLQTAPEAAAPSVLHLDTDCGQITTWVLLDSGACEQCASNENAAQ